MSWSEEGVAGRAIEDGLHLLRGEGAPREQGPAFLAGRAG